MKNWFLVFVLCVLAVLAAGCAGSADTVGGQNPSLPVMERSAVPDAAREPDTPALGVSETPAQTGDDPAPVEKTTSEPEPETVTAPRPPAERKGPTVTLLVTRDYGSSNLFREEVRLEDGDTVLDVLNRNLAVGTAYGGKFVESINGLASRSGSNSAHDWLFWVNGVSSALGAASFKLRPGDHIWWDYQDWAGSYPVAAVVGAYPQPFVSGHRERPEKTVVLYAPGADAHAAAVARQLTGQGTAVTLSAVDEDLLKRRKHPTVVVGIWEALKESATLSGLNDRGRRAGLFVSFGDTELLELQSSGIIVDRHGAGSGTISAVGSGPGDQAPLWIISGVDPDGLAAAVRVFTEEPSAMDGAFALVLTEGRIIRVPRQTN